MDFNKISVAVIGVGHLGSIHANLYTQIPEAELVGVYDINQETCEKVATELNVRAFKNLEELWPQVDAVNIVTPTTSHFDLAMAALQNDKHVFIEKPVTEKVFQAYDLKKFAEHKGLKIQIGHIERFNPAILALEGVQLNPIFIEAHRLATFKPRGTDVAVVLDLMIHDIDLILSMIKSEPTRISANGVGVVSSNIDIANARIEFKNGCVANLTASRISAKKMRKMRIFQKDAYISMDFNDGVSEIFYLENDDHPIFENGTLALSLGQLELGELKREIKYNRLKREQVNPLQAELISFIDAIKNNLQPAVTIQDGINALSLAQKVMKEIKRHQQYLSRQMGMAIHHPQQEIKAK
ncbi:MAG TPA: Gfo/Idh/MocA family oxidoreductase [Caldithrix abyssi]|uniref:Gfo/Idh/MocA family oxidoreductase n=1 Tax=Caldithrix abyssi TaxID=187145 RepID=A0A7V5H5G7_CALAY|nr:Gfo/Idh/MocA family oxidoreductase [Caldisericaceae bacterium]HHE55850.1 Gfo/Idh/MocA family oxidoreductase [Caldithrix abyssi]